MRIAVGADHAGFSMKQALADHLRGRGLDVVDCGADSTEPVDYPDYGAAVGRAVASGRADLGLCVCGTGIGIAMAANKIAGVAGRRRPRHHLGPAGPPSQRRQRAVPGGAAGGTRGGPRGSRRLAGRRLRGGPPHRPGGQDRRPRRLGLRDWRPGRIGEPAVTYALAASGFRDRRPGHTGEPTRYPHPQPPGGFLMPWPAADRAVSDLIRREERRQNTTIQLIASENFASPAVMAATGSVFTNKYSEGYPGRRYYGGNAVVDEVEDLARHRACELFGAEHANVQPHAGAIANMIAYQALLDPGDTVLGMSLDHGGHLTHGSPVNFSGALYNFVSYGVTASDERIDLDQLRDLALSHRPKLIVAGATAYPRLIHPEPLREIADEVGARLMFDAAHIAGLIAGGAHPNPVPTADVVTFTTHKTLRGPRGGGIVCRSDLAAAIDKAAFPGIQGGPLDHAVAAKAQAFAEAATDDFRDYARRIVGNARALAEALAGPRLPAGLRRHRQPSAAGRSPVVRCRPHRQAGPGRFGRGRDQPQQEHGARRPAVAVRDVGGADRHPGGDHPGDGRGRHGRRRRPHRPGPGRPRRPLGAGRGRGRGPGPVRGQAALPRAGLNRRRALAGGPSAGGADGRGDQLRGGAAHRPAGRPLRGGGRARRPG